MDIAAAKQHLGEALTSEGGLFDPIRYMSYHPSTAFITLDGNFDVEDLEAIVAIMRAGTEEAS